MVLITPRLVRALEPDEVPPLPTLPRRFLPGPGTGGEKPPGGNGKSEGQRDQDKSSEMSGALVDAPPVKKSGTTPGTKNRE